MTNLDKSDKLQETNITLNEWFKGYFNEVYEPWQTKEQLTPWLEVKRDLTINTHTHSATAWQWWQVSYDDLTDKPTAYEPEFYQENKTTFTWVYSAWNFTVTCWFPPRRIDIEASTWTGYDWFSTWQATVDWVWTIKNWCRYWDWNFWWDSVISATKLIYIKNGAATTTAYVSSVTSTWFVLTVDNNNWNFNTWITVQW